MMHDASHVNVFLQFFFLSSRDHYHNPAHDLFLRNLAASIIFIIASGVLIWWYVGQKSLL